MTSRCPSNRLRQGAKRSSYVDMSKLCNAVSGDLTEQPAFNLKLIRGTGLFSSMALLRLHLCMLNTLRSARLALNENSLRREAMGGQSEVLAKCAKDSGSV